MFRKNIIPLLVILLLLSACSNYKTRVYKGETSDWKADYVYKETSTKGYEYIFQLTYKNDVSGLSELKDFTIKFKAGSGETGGTLPISILKNGAFTSSGAYEGTSLLREDSQIKVYVNWGTNEDSFVLEYND
ncbi:hypothetical protein [Ureibacillus acetophenoni]|uniref:Lipoprotein n=1 Tax=Ureibacillus acetophenoni TaxID=614649 RepID=A0A285UP62_9BACL|nr:hypothetical protein [Ureibacillus acetophenoni]SOC43660.1 hypothetical protein SAMN05877842_1174 [Ureibacillus acetophenoni]